MKFSNWSAMAGPPVSLLQCNLPRAAAMQPVPCRGAARAVEPGRPRPHGGVPRRSRGADGRALPRRVDLRAVEHQVARHRAPVAVDLHLDPEARWQVTRVALGDEEVLEVVVDAVARR